MDSPSHNGLGQSDFNRIHFRVRKISAASPKNPPSAKYRNIGGTPRDSEAFDTTAGALPVELAADPRAAVADSLLRADWSLFPDAPAELKKKLV